MEAIRTFVIIPFTVPGMLNGNGFQIVWPIGLFYASGGYRGGSGGHAPLEAYVR